MKVSLNWAQHYASESLSPDGVNELITRMGAQLGAIEEVVDISRRYKDVVVAKVVICEKHPNADRLRVCRINDGGVVQDIERDENGLVQVVCGAPNVREGLMVAWLPPGTTVPSSVNDQEPFVLESREIRGALSNGMLASPKELGISNDHEGILEINAADTQGVALKPGLPFVSLYELDDVVIDCENKMFTHRPDCFGILGVAREIAGIQHIAFKSPDWYIEQPSFTKVDGLPLSGSIQDSSLCSRIMFVVVRDVVVAPSPMWLQTRLSKVGLKPINTIVDITNYYMHLTGQPTHAYDYDKVAAHSGGDPTLTVRASRKGETIALLNGKTVALHDGTAVIATDKSVVGIAGVMGGAETEVDSQTKNIIIEVGTFDMYQIRRASMHYGLFTDAVTRFNKGQSPLQNDRVLARMLDEISELAHGVQASNVIDCVTEKVAPMPAIDVEADFINTRLGSTISATEMAELLRNVEVDAQVQNDSLRIVPPFWRRDLSMPEDIVEEVGRLYGFDKLPVELPVRRAKAPLKDEMLQWKSELRTVLSDLGANELLTYSFVHSDLLARAGLNTEHVFHIRNAISPELQYYRLSLLPSLLDKVAQNIRSDLIQPLGNTFALFEINKVHIRGLQDQEDPNVPAEHERLALVFAADDKTARLRYAGEPYYVAAEYLKQLCAALGVAYELQPVDTVGDSTISAPFDANRTAAIIVNGETVGFVGECNAAVEKAFKLPSFTAGFEVDAKALLQARQKKSYTVMPNHPKTEQDITFEIASDVHYKTLYAAVTEFLSRTSQDNKLFWHCEPLDIFSPTDENIRITFRIWLASYDKTLQTSEVNQLLTDLTESVSGKLQIVRI